MSFFDREFFQQFFDCSESFLEIPEFIANLQSVRSLQTESTAVILH